MTMPTGTALITTIAIGFGTALTLGFVAARLGLPPIVGYLLAGIAVGPFTPGLVAHGTVASEAAELGVVLLMFGVGLHFSLRDLMAVRTTVVPAALLLIAVATVVGTTLGHVFGLHVGGAIVFGLSLSVASTVVALKALESRDRLDSPEGRLTVGWLVVEDMAMIVVLVLLPALAPLLGGTGPSPSGASALAVVGSIAVAIAKVTAFMVLMFAVGRRVVPWMLEHVARLGSRELFTLTVLSIALGVGTIASQLFGMSFALGAFVAGAVVSESELSHRAAADALPLQDAFAVLFFVSVGMLFDPRVLIDHPVQVLAVLGVVVLGRFAVAFTVLRLLGQSARAALTAGTSVAQIGEFSFILMGLGVSLGLLGSETQALVVAASMLSITLNQPLTKWLHRRLTRSEQRAMPEPATDPFDFGTLAGHVILVGYGRVGSTVTEALDRAGVTHIVVEEQPRVVVGLRLRGEHSVSGDATRPDVLNRAGVAGARLIIVTAPEPIRARRVVEVARSLNPRIVVAVRTHSATEQAFFEEVLRAPGIAGRAVYAEREVALSLAHYALTAIGRTDDDADVLIDSMRRKATLPTETFAAMQTREFQAAMATKMPPRQQ
ncbi:MAG: cation:proton antiporter [bacterium]